MHLLRRITYELRKSELDAPLLRSTLKVLHVVFAGMTLPQLLQEGDGVMGGTNNESASGLDCFQCAENGRVSHLAWDLLHVELWELHGVMSASAVAAAGLFSRFNIFLSHGI